MPESDRVVISNTTPIVSLALIGKLDLLRMLYGKVWIPPAVKAELVAGGVRAGAREVDDVDYLRVATLVDPRRAGLLSDLDRGEAEVIALALEYKSPLVLMDERLGRRYAERVGLSVTGVLGVLLRAKKEGYLSSIKPLIVQLRHTSGGNQIGRYFGGTGTGDGKRTIAGTHSLLYKKGRGTHGVFLAPFCI